MSDLPRSSDPPARAIYSGLCVIAGDGRPPRFAEATWGRPVGREVLVEVRSAAICRTDLDAIGWPGQRILGHEGAGIVRCVGSAVEGLEPGSRVLFNWAIPCGCCRACRSGEPYLCASDAALVGPHPLAAPPPTPPVVGGAPMERMFDLGLLAEYALVDEAALTVLPPTIDFSEACILGCAVMTGAGSVWNVAKVQPRESVAVLGAGAVGLNAIQAARIAGAAPIVAIDSDEAALDRASRMGATHVIDSGANDLSATAGGLADIVPGGVDHAFEATGRTELALAPLSLVRNGGTAVQMSGLDQTCVLPETPLGAFLWNKTYVVSLYGACVPGRDFPRLFDLHASGQLKLDEQIEMRRPFAEALEAFAAAGRGEGKQVLILPGRGE